MIFEFALVYLLACPAASGEDQLRRVAQDSPNTHCDFDDPGGSYDATDLLGCLQNLMVNSVDGEGGRSASEGVPRDKSIYGDNLVWSTFGNVVSSLLNGNPQTQYPSSPPDATSSYYQSNYPSIPAGALDFPKGIQVNVLEALSSISRYDDYKCVPRIICEVASGRPPGRASGKQLGLFENLGRNPLLQWLSGFDIADSSAVLSFGRAAILGYSNRGNSGSCYEAFPKCPRDQSGLIYYLNNYNGGLFRFFSNAKGGSHQKYPSYYPQQVNGYSKARKEEPSTFSVSKGYSHRGPEKHSVHFAALRNHVDRERNIFPADNRREVEKRVVFPVEEESTRHSFEDETSKSFAYFDANILEGKRSLIFPEEEDEGDRRFRISKNKIVFLNVPS